MTPIHRLSAHSVCRRYGSRTVLHDATLELEGGKVCALLGPSGSGKSTLLRLLAGLEAVDGGEVRLDGMVVSRPGLTVPPEQRRVGVVFQDYALFPHLDALGNVAFGLTHRPREERRNTALRWLSAVGLADKAHAHPQHLSGGEQQRVALARALAPEPRAVLLDEPFSGLDAVLRAELRDLTLTTLRSTQAAILFVTHDADEALAVADTLAVLEAGRIAQAGPPAALWHAPASLGVAAALGPLNLWRGAVAGGKVATPFGDVPTEVSEGSAVIVAVRHGALRLGPGANAQVSARRPLGDLLALEVHAASSPEVRWRALLPADRAPGLGPCGVNPSTDGWFVFPA